jgi:hypothetical protein
MSERIRSFSKAADRIPSFENEGGSKLFIMILLMKIPAPGVHIFPVLECSRWQSVSPSSG